MRSVAHQIRHKKRTGAILVMIIGIIFLLGFIVTEYLSLVTDEIRRKNDTTGNYFLKIESYNALELTVAYLTSIQEVDKGLFGPKQGWNKIPMDVIRDPDASDTQQTKITITDETGKIGLRKPKKDWLTALFKQLKFDDSVSQDLADSLINWVNKKKTTGPFDSYVDFYNDQDPAYFAANTSLINYDELRYVKGFRENFFDEAGNPNEAFTKFKEATSLFNDEGINLNTAPAIVIDVLSEITGITKNEFISKLWGPDEEPGTKDDTILRDPKPLKALTDKKYRNLLQVNPSYLKITIHSNFGERLHTLSALVQVPKEKQKEDQQQPATTNPNQPTPPKPQTKKTENKDLKLLLMQENQPLD